MENIIVKGYIRDLAAKTVETVEQPGYGSELVTVKEIPAGFSVGDEVSVNCPVGLLVVLEAVSKAPDAPDPVNA